MTEEQEKKQLTICSAYHTLERKYLLEIQWDLINKLNSRKDWIWIAADNTPSGLSEHDALDSSTFIVIKGVSPRKIIPPNAPKHYQGAYHYGEAVNKMIKEVSTRFLLVLDNDFFVVRPEWITEVLDHMQKNNLAFFGVPWNARRPGPYRYFPAIHCFFVDLKKIPKETLDFNPFFDDDPLSMPLFRKLENRFSFSFPYRIRKILKTLSIADRKTHIGSYRDVAYDIFRRYGNKPGIRYGSTSTVFDPDTQMGAPSMRSRWNRFVEIFLPDRVCFLPKRRGYYTNIGFRELGYFDVRGTNPRREEFVWKGKLFGFHLRGGKTVDNPGNVAPLEDTLHFVSSALDNLTRA